MSRLIVIEFVSLDGVMHDPDGSDGTPQGGWAFRYGREAVAGDKFGLGEILDTGSMLLGRRTWQRRAVDLQVRVSATATGRQLPVILLSHGHGNSNNLSSLNGYAPLASYWAAHGFAVIQPTHLDSKTLGRRDSGDPEAPLYWRSRAGDMTRILDQLDVIEAAVPRLPGRLDRSRVAVAGHSMGGQPRPARTGRIEVGQAADGKRHAGRQRYVAGPLPSRLRGTITSSPSCPSSCPSCSSCSS